MLVDRVRRPKVIVVSTIASREDSGVWSDPTPSVTNLKLVIITPMSRLVTCPVFIHDETKFYYYSMALSFPPTIQRKRTYVYSNVWYVISSVLLFLSKPMCAIILTNILF